MLLIFPVVALAQQPISRHLIVPTDTGRVYLEGTSVELSSIPEEKSTSLAMLLSALVPGAGQVYTERYLSIPVIWGFGLYFGKTIYDNNKDYQDYRGRFDASVRADTAQGLGDSHLKDVRDFYRDQRDRFAVYLGLTYLLNIVDAYVGAALYGFDVSPDLSGGAKVRYRVKL